MALFSMSAKDWCDKNYDKKEISAIPTMSPNWFACPIWEIISAFPPCASIICCLYLRLDRGGGLRDSPVTNMKTKLEQFVNDKQFNCHENRRRILLTLFAVLLLLFAAAGVGAADNYPQRTGMAVNDFAHVIDAENAAKMESLAREILQKTGASVVVATVPTMGENQEVKMYTNGLYSAWGIGKKGEDRGVLIFLALKEKKIRIEPGYGLEGVLPDGLVGEILDKYVVPQLRAGETGKAMYNAMFACGTYIAKDKNVELTGVAMPYRSKAKPQKKGFGIGGIIVFLICAAVLLGTRTGRQMLPWILLMLMSGGRGGGRDDGFGGGFDGFGGGSSGGGGADRDF